MTDSPFIDNNKSTATTSNNSGGCGCLTLIFAGILLGVIASAITFGLGYPTTTAILVGGVVAAIPFMLYLIIYAFWAMVVFGLLGLFAAIGVTLGLRQSLK